MGEAQPGEPVDIPRASEMPSAHLDPEWSDIEIFDPEGAFASFKERLRREMAANQQVAELERIKARNASESARQHDDRAAEIWHLLDAMQRAPVTFRAPTPPSKEHNNGE